MVNEKDAIEIIFYAEENEIAIWLDVFSGVFEVVWSGLMLTKNVFIEAKDLNLNGGVAW